MHVAVRCIKTDSYMLLLGENNKSVSLKHVKKNLHVLKENLIHWVKPPSSIEPLLHSQVLIEMCKGQHGHRSGSI